MNQKKPKLTPLEQQTLDELLRRIVIQVKNQDCPGDSIRYYAEFLEAALLRRRFS